MANMGQVEREVKELARFIKKLGTKNDKGQYVVTFGVLFDDDEAANTFEAIVGTLRSAKKRSVIKFKGQMLLKGAHDNVPITLLKGNDDDDGDAPAPNDDTTDDVPDNTQNIDNTQSTDNIQDANDANIDDNNANASVEEAKPSEIVQEPVVTDIQQDTNDNKENNDNKSEMVEIHGRCIESGCKCEKYVENPSKWSKGKCNTCDHPPIRHKKQWVKPESVIEPKLPRNKEAVPRSSVKKKEIAEVAAEPEEEEEEVLANEWGKPFTDKLGECVNDTFGYDNESILPAKYLLHYLKNKVGFDFTGQSEHRNALKYALVETFGWKAINKWGYNVYVL